MIVLDTHALLWWIAEPSQLGRRARVAIDGALRAAAIYVSSISAWELALLVKRGRLELSLDVADWLARVESLPYVHFVPVDNRIAGRSAALPGLLHDDPADRIIVATALTLGTPLITKDRRLHGLPWLKAVW